MEITQYISQESDLHVSCPRGGPIYDPDLVGLLTSIREFRPSVVKELQSLEAELCVNSTIAFEDELKVFTEEELVDKALKEAFEDAVPMESSSQLSEHHCNEMRTDIRRISNNEIACFESSGKETSTFESCESSSPSVVEACNEDCSRKMGKRGSKTGKKRGRVFDRDIRATELESSYITKVKELAEVKKKQDEDKAAARLHSFNGSAMIIEHPISASDKIERLKSLRFITSAMKVKSSSTSEYVPVSYPEVVLTIEIYHNIKVHKKTQEFLVLGRQLLTDLRDNIYCLTDHLMQKAEQHDPSGYFLIEDVFYNDLRDPSAIDYSEPIFDWLRNHKDEALDRWECVISGELQKMRKSLLGGESISHLPDFKAIDMHKTRFCDLRFRLGSGYLYCHQGDCKHIIVIRDMRLIHPDDVQNGAAYPIRTFQRRPHCWKCSICKIYRATKVTVNDKWAQENPSYFCDNCYFLLHYAEDGSLLYNEFTVYDYHLD
ncbi:snRNA activating complex family protein isoform X2 [Tasmannia lanceolata]|uniref:snRNA activating complex family protein isoform X2 n=1 Tax=Tasmannia lanceolata TaxID=3420 RepID=UPI00406415D1